MKLITLRLSLQHDQDILDFLSYVPNLSYFLKSLIRREIKNSEDCRGIYFSLLSDGSLFDMSEP